jgi:hypothetical protein
MDEFSHLGYVAFFGLIEIISKENGTDVTGKLSVRPSHLGRKLRTTPARLRQVFDYCQTNGRLTVDYSGKEWDFVFTKIAKIKDNYTKDLQGACKKLSKHKEKEEEEEKEKEPPISPKGGQGVLSKRFDKFWTAYPKKKSKGGAEAIWKKLKPSEQLLAAMVAKIEQAKTSTEWTKDNGQFIPYPATWLNGKGWEDEFAEGTTGDRFDFLTKDDGS